MELQDRVDPGVAWGAEVEENVGGRLRLRLAGTEGLPETHSTLWLYYLHPHLHPPGWAKEHGCTLRPPSGKLLFSERSWVNSVSRCKKLNMIHE